MLEKVTYRLHYDVQVDWLDVFKARLSEHIAMLEAKLEVLTDIRDILAHPKFNEPLIATAMVKQTKLNGV